MLSVSELKVEVLRRSIKFSVIAQLASVAGSVCYGCDVTSFFNGRHTAVAKGERIRAAVQRLIDLIDADSVRLDLSTVENVIRAEKRLAENKTKAPATVSYMPIVAAEHVLSIDIASPAKIAASQSREKIDKAATKVADGILSVM
jgi:hypothetical protein